MNKVKKNVLLYGVFSVNLGDDLFFKILFERYPDVNFILLAPVIYKSIFSGYDNCIVISDKDKFVCRLKSWCEIFHIPYMALLYVCILIKYRVRLFLIAGGSLFIEGNSNIPSLINKLCRIRFILPYLKIAVIGSNYGPAKTEKWKIIVEDAIGKVDDICFRDKSSYQIFSHLPNVRFANDIVMHMPINAPANKRDVLCVNIRSVDKWPALMTLKKEYLSNTKRIIADYQNKGYKVVLLSFCRSYGDTDITNELYNSLETKENVQKLEYLGDIKNILEVISTSKCIIATRFHAVVLGLIYNIQTIPISYSIKTENMLKSYQLWNPIFDFNAYCLANYRDIQNNVISDFKLESSSNTQFQYTDKLLNN